MSSDWELHELCSQKKDTIPQLVPFLLSNEQVFGVSGKMNKLKEILEKLKKGLLLVYVFIIYLFIYSSRKPPSPYFFSNDKNDEYSHVFIRT